MVIATRLLNLLSGVIVLVTGMYAEASLTGYLSETMRVIVICAAAAYFLVQFSLQILRPLPALNHTLEEDKIRCSERP
ncbi:hypothetical protein GF377_06960 [candidate division GN15 bacterium]|nr:hypothetical protein [candidate division GN15 bacterium]